MSSNIDTRYKTIFATAVELASALHDAQVALRQHMADASDELITEGMDKAEAKAIRKDLAEIKALAMIEAQGEEKRRAAGEKIDRRQRIAHVVGVQLDFDFAANVGAMLREAGAVQVKIKSGRRGAEAPQP